MAEKIERELEVLRNTIKSEIPYDNAYFMHVHTVCTDIVNNFISEPEDEVGILRLVNKALPYAKSGGNMNTELVALTYLMEIPEVLQEEKLKELETTKNTIIKTLQKRADVDFFHPRKYVAYLVKLANDKEFTALLAEFLYLQVMAEIGLEEGSRVDKLINNTTLAYIDTQLDLNNLALDSLTRGARNDFAILVNKFDI